MTVDCHTHIFESGSGGPLDLPASADDLVRQMDEHGIDRAIILPLPGMATNEFVHEQCAKRPDRLSGLYTPEFENPSTVVQSMESFSQDHPVWGLKIHPRVQNVSINDGLVRETLYWAAERGLPVLFDVFIWGPSLGKLDLEPFAYHLLAQAIPSLRMVLAHAGGHKILDAFLVAKANPNVYLDISFTPVYFNGSSISRDVSFICSRLPAGRVLYGSDFPFTYFRQHLDIVRELTLDLDDKHRSEIFGDAAKRLFRLV